nr:MAG TPA: major capsid protein [Bacteriophage sp.]
MPGVTTSTVLNTDSTLKAREIDFVTRFEKNWDALRTILGIVRPIRKEPGTSLVTYEAQMKDETLQGGASVGEGEAIPFTQFKVVESKREDIVVEKYAKSLSLESVSKWGATVAIEKTDDAFMVELQNKVLKDFYTFLKTGTLKGTQKKWQKALAIAKGAVLNKFAGMNRNVTEVVGFANVMDFYDWLGDKEITVQTMFGLQYIKNFFGFSTLFLLPDDYIPAKTVIATPVENIDLYYIDPGDSDFKKLGLDYTTSGETNLIGFHAGGNYTNATGETYAIMGMKLWAEYLDGVCVVTVGTTETIPEVSSTVSEASSNGK